MTTAYQKVQSALRRSPRTWLLTGAAGFIGSHLLEALLLLGQRVIGLDNLSTGTPANLERVRAAVSPDQWKAFQFHHASITDMGACREATKGVEIVLHQAGFVSVPLSLADPVGCHDVNVTGTLNLLVASRDHHVRRFVYASSSAIYGDHPAPVKVEELLGKPLSPYGASKLMGEEYVRLFAETYGLPTMALRYFNVFGPRQNSIGGYAAVIPRWIAQILHGEACTIFDPGDQTRDFCPVANIVQANLLAAAAPATKIAGGIYNVGLGEGTALRTLYTALVEELRRAAPHLDLPEPQRSRARPGDVLHSTADISAAREHLRYEPEVPLTAGLAETVRWFSSQAEAAPLALATR